MNIMLTMSSDARTIQASRKRLWHKALDSEVKRQDVLSLMTGHPISKRHACTLVGLSRDSYRNVGQTSALNMKLPDQMMQSQHNSRRWGYRIIHDVLRPNYPDINHKRVDRIDTVEDLSMRKRKKIKRIGRDDLTRLLD